MVLEQRRENTGVFRVGGGFVIGGEGLDGDDLFFGATEAAGDAATGDTGDGAAAGSPRSRTSCASAANASARPLLPPDSLTARNLEPT